MEKRAKIAWLYLIAALFIAVGLFFVVKKNTYLFFALPVVLGVLLLYIFSLDKVLMLTSFCVPLSVNLKALEAGLAISLPAEPLLMGILVLFLAKMLYDGKYDKRISHHPSAIFFHQVLYFFKNGFKKGYYNWIFSTGNTLSYGFTRMSNLIHHETN